MTRLSTGVIIVLITALSSVMASTHGAGTDTARQTPEAIAVLESQAAAGSDKAQMKLGIIYLEGRGVTADIDKALFYYRLAAEREIAFAHLKLAKIYLNGKYAEPDAEKALSWLLSSAGLGYVRAQLDLSDLYENGTVVSQDMVKAHQWVSIASSLTDMDLEPRKEAIEAKMTFTEVAYATLRSRLCILNGYEDC